MSEGVTVYEGVPAPLKVADMKAQVNLIQEVMRDVMQKDEHYGVIPGTGAKPSLLKAGAEKLIMTFRLVPDIEEQTIEYDGGHREVRVKVKMFAQNGVYLGSGVGSCSTMEGKYRFRTGEITLTNKPVPQDYWTLRKENPAAALELIGGKGHTAKKNDVGQWVIAIAGDKVEHDNPADYYNTVLKMAKKRALVDACLTVTAASDIFTQDTEDMSEVISGAAASEVPIKQSVPDPKPKKTDKDATVDNYIAEGHILEVSVKQGGTEKKPWTKYGVKLIDGDNWYGTFNKDFGELAESAKEFDKPIRITFKQNGKYFNIETLEIAEDREPGAEG